jgi:15-cis-phytoene synthase
VSAAACADLVRRGDPDRWRAAMTAPPGARDGLMALYAFNLEVARAAYVASDPMLGAIRLRWWTDALAEIFAGAAARRHEVCAPLAETIRASALPRDPLDAMIDARGWDCGREGFADLAALEDYLDATAGEPPVARRPPSRRA